MDWDNVILQPTSGKQDEKRKNGRKFPLNRRVVVLLGIFVVMMLLLGMSLDATLIFDVSVSPNQAYLRESGIPVKANITRTEQYAPGCSCRWSATYYFETPDGVGHFQTAAIDSVTYSTLAEGVSVDVLYAPDDPNMSDLAGSVLNSTAPGIKFPIFTLLLPGVTIVVMVLFNRYYVMRWVMLAGIVVALYAGGVANSETWLRGMERLRADGFPADGTIMSLSKTGESESRSYFATFQVVAPDESGQSRTFTFTHRISSNQYLLIAAGDIKPVMYLKDGSDAIFTSDLDTLDSTLLRSRALYGIVLAGLIGLFVVGWIMDTGHRERWLMERGRLPRG